MSLIILNVDEVRRTLSASGGAFVVHDKEVDIVRFAINSGFADIVLDGQVALRVMYQRPGETEVKAQTLTYYDTDGLHNYYDWQLAQSDLAKNGSLMVALCILDISGGEVSEWHTTPCAVRVLSTIHTDDSDEGDDTITPTVKERVAVLESMIQRVASGAPIVVSSTSAMTDTNQIYVLSTNGKWYYYNGTAWVSGGTYGAVSTDTTLTQSGIPADAKAAGDVKEDLSDIQNLEALSIKLEWTQGGISTSGGNASSNYRIRTTYTDLGEYDSMYANIQSGFTAKIFFYSDSTYKSAIGPFTESRDIAIPSEVNKFRVYLYKGNGSSVEENLIIPSEGNANLALTVSYALKDEIEGIHEDISAVDAKTGKKETRETAELRQGGLNSATGAYSSSTMTRVSSSKAEKIDLDSGFYIAQWLHGSIYWYGNSGWNDYKGLAGVPSGMTTLSGLTIPEGATHFRINLAREGASTTNLAPSDITEDDCYFVWRDEYITTLEAEDIVETHKILQSLSPRVLLSCKDGNADPTIPPDSYYAIRETAKSGYDAIRFSVYKTTDNDFVAVHDVTINSLAVNPDGTTISERIETGSCSVAELNQYDWGLKYGEQYRGLEVPMLDDCLRYASLYNLSVAIDFKNPSTYTQADMSAFMDLLLNRGHDNAILIRANSTEQAYMVSRSPRISVEHIGDLASLNSNMERLRALMTGHNHIYWANTGERTTEALSTSYANGFELTGSADTIADLADDISLGARYEEVTGIKNVKEQLRSHTDTLN